MSRLFIALMLISSSAFSFTYSTVQKIYSRLCVANHISHCVPIVVDYSIGKVNAVTVFGSFKIPVQIVIYGGMMREVRNIDELASVIGHELGHTQVWWQRKGPKNELAADHLGFKFMNQAGYNVCRGAQLIKRFHRDPTGVHPLPSYRYKQSGCK